MLDKEFISIFAPMHFISTCLFIRKYNLYKNQVTQSSKRGIVFAVIGLLFVCFFLILTINSLSIIFNGTSYYMYLFVYIQYAVGCGMIIFLNLYHSKSHTKILITLQMTERYLPDRNNIRKIRIIVWISCTTIILSHVIFTILKILLDPFWTKQGISKSCFIILTLILDFELFYSTIVIYLMSCKMKQWTQLLKKKDKQTSKGNRISEFTLEMLYKTYKSLLDSLTLVKTSTQWTILLHFVISFTQSMTFFGILMLCTGNEVSVKMFVKRIQRLTSLQYKKLNGCGVFVVDAKLPLHLGALILNHTVVLLQFALTKLWKYEDDGSKKGLN
nr:gustatory receptor 31 [Papilio dardanus]